jgi:hypothetical protein
MTSTRPDVKDVFMLSLGAFVVWLACGLTMAFGQSALGLETALRIHAIAAPAFAALVWLVYLTRFRAVTPLVAAAFVTCSSSSATPGSSPRYSKRATRCS